MSSPLEKKIRKLSGKAKTRGSKNIARAYVSKNIGKVGSALKNKIKKLKGDTSWN